MQKLIDRALSSGTRDPHVILHNGTYYRCYSGAPNSIYIAAATTIADLAYAEGKRVYTAEAGKPYSKELWAPELHVLDGKCYIYVACDDGNNHNHRMYVLENGSVDPLEPYVMHGKIADSTDRWAIDGTVMQYHGEKYFVWSGWEGDVNVCHNLYIAKMKDPYPLEGERVLLSRPEYEWEKRGATGKEESPFINEGPYVFEWKGTVYMTYSASGSWCRDYCIAALVLVGDDPLCASHWKKCEAPLFSENELVMGAGHCSVICQADGTHVFFHAWDRQETDVRWNTVSVWWGKLSVDVTGLSLE